MVEIITSLGGSLLGFLGNAGSSWLKNREKDKDLEREVKRLAHEKEIIKETQKGEISKAEVTKETTESAEIAATIRAAYKADKATYLSGIDVSKFKDVWGYSVIVWGLALVDVARGMVRPTGANWAMCIMSYMVIYGPEETRSNVVLAIIGLASSILSFYFVDRIRQKEKP